MSKRSLSQEFLISFGRLKEITHNKPERLVSFYNDSAELQRLRSNIEEHFYLRSKYVLSRKKVIPTVSSVYLDAVEEYETDWKRAFQYLDYLESWELLQDIYEEDEPLPFDTFTGCRDDRELLDPSPEWESDFDPMKHHGWDAIKMLLDVGREEISTRACVEDEFYTEQEQRLENIESLADGALLHLKDTIGIDLEDVFTRYRRVPPIYVPKHVSDRHGLTAKDGLYHLLSNAILSYVAGAFGASVAMCRAILEILLKDHYVTDHKDKNGRVFGLQKLIVLADERYSYFEKGPVDRIRTEGDRILHNLKNIGWLSKTEEDTVLEFLKTLKSLIEKVERAS